MQPPTSNAFVYNRKNPPLFFIPYKTSDQSRWRDSAALIAKEFFKGVRLENISSYHLLSNGMTVGEYAMYVIADTHKKRKLNDSTR